MAKADEPEVVFNVAGILASLTGAYRRRMEAVGELVAKDAQRRAPRSPGAGHAKGGGHAADTVTYQVSVEDGAIEARVGATKAGWYLVFAETGTSKQKASPWLRPAVDANRGEIARILKAD